MSGEVLGQCYVSGPEPVQTTVSQPDLDLSGNCDDVLAAWRAVPIAEITRVELAKHYAGGGLKGGHLRMVLQLQLFDMCMAVIATVQPYQIQSRSPQAAFGASTALPVRRNS